MVKVRERLTYANVVATIALFAALGGGAYAAFHDKSPVQKGLHLFRIHKSLNEHDSGVVLFKRGAFKLAASCFVPSQGTSTQASAYIVGKRQGMDVASTFATENDAVKPHVDLNDGADAGDPSGVVDVTATNQFATIADANFGATLPADSGNATKTITGNIVALARHGATGRDCTFTGHLAFG